MSLFIGPVYSDYHGAQVFKDKPALPVFKTNPVFKTKEELEFRTGIRQGTASGPNFVGHCAVIQWGGVPGPGTSSSST